MTIDDIKADDIKKVAKKAYKIYKEVDDFKEEEENKLIEAFEKSPLNRYIDSEPEVNPVISKLYFFFLFF